MTKDKRTRKETSSRRHLNNFVKEEEEAEEARTLLYNMQLNVDKADAKVTEARGRLSVSHGTRNLDDHTISWDKMWQMMQSNDITTMNLDKDFEEMVRKAKQTGWNGSTKTTRF